MKSKQFRCCIISPVTMFSLNKILMIFCVPSLVVLTAQHKIPTSGCSKSCQSQPEAKLSSKKISWPQVSCLHPQGQTLQCSKVQGTFTLNVSEKTPMFLFLMESIQSFLLALPGSVHQHEPWRYLEELYAVLETDWATDYMQQVP